ncbi:hypothetical protein IEQ34_016777 [Dendrobium chrysotoxum]|uniref:Pentatricopeptide repeat-containing protein n=1 Tax=Dendrobium chrysotoxum TaxID=161865 RepID=A0AAV7GGL3_DENCH|nr:hypothetical protein IEQ34_016777 [Dendrobium chrysotoxum]
MIVQDDLAIVQDDMIVSIKEGARTRWSEIGRDPQSGVCDRVFLRGFGGDFHLHQIQVLCLHQEGKKGFQDSSSDSSEIEVEEKVTNLCLMVDDHLDHSDQEEMLFHRDQEPEDPLFDEEGEASPAAAPAPAPPHHHYSPNVGQHALRLGVSLDMCCFSILIKGFCQLEKLEAGFSLLHKISKQGLLPHATYYLMLMHALCKHGRVKEAFETSEMMEREGFILMP